MDKSYPSKLHGCSISRRRETYNQIREDGEVMLEHNVWNLSTTGPNSTGYSREYFDISNTPIILTYLLFQRNLNSNIIGCVDTSNLYDPHKAISHKGFMYLHGGLSILLMSSKQTLMASYNHQSF